MLDMRIRITRVTSSEEIARQIEPRMQNLERAIVKRARRLVPKRSWALHDTIRGTTERDGGIVRTRVTAGSDDVDYATYVERGTSRMAAQPYLRPAMLQSRASDFGVLS